jgi:hypothetical protein
MFKLRPVVMVLLAGVVIGTAAWYLISLTRLLAGSIVQSWLVP